MPYVILPDDTYHSVNILLIAKWYLAKLEVFINIRLILYKDVLLFWVRYIRYF